MVQILRIMMSLAFVACVLTGSAPTRITASLSSVPSEEQEESKGSECQARIDAARYRTHRHQQPRDLPVATCILKQSAVTRAVGRFAASNGHVLSNGLNAPLRC